MWCMRRSGPWSQRPDTVDEQRELATVREELPGSGPQLPSLIEMTFRDRAGGEVAEDRRLRRRGRAQMNRQFEGRHAYERPARGQDRRPPEVSERHQADRVVLLLRVVLVQAHPAAG